MLCPGYVTMRRAPHVQAAAQHFRRQVGRELVARPAEQVHRDQRLAAHRVDVGQGVGSGDPAERVRIVHDRGEEVGGHHDRQGRADPDHGAVVAMLDPHHQVRARASGHEPGDRLLQLARRDLAGAAAAVRILSEPDHIRTSHAVNDRPPPDHAPLVTPAGRVLPERPGGGVGSGMALGSEPVQVQRVRHVGDA